MKQTQKKNLSPLGTSLVILASFFYASYGIWTTLMGNFFGGYTAATLRSVLVLLILVPIALVAHKFEKIHWKRDWRYLAGLALAAALIWGPFYYSILHAGIGLSLSVNYASIVIGMFVFGWLFAHERFTKDKALSACIGLIGLALVFLPTISGGGSWLALGAAIVSGLNSAATMVLAKKMPYNATQATILIWMASVVGNIFMLFFITEPQPLIGWHLEWLYLFLFAVASVIASWALVKGMKQIDAGIAGILGLLEIVFGLLFGIFLFGERPSWVALIGMFVILLAAAIPYLKDYKKKRMI